ncbi:MAG TPA: acyl-CoA dehydrogenase family protein, partial [Acidimicrobiia bacterium]|nr:acyl-CoA dehydrogenase family protein [Acidimicrobiia bacterium]
VTALAYTVGAAESALDLSVQHARDRQQFGTPIGSFQAVAHRCADMRAEIDACRLLAYRAAWALGGDHEHVDVAFAVSSALGYAKDALRRVAMHAHQVHGAIGFSTEHDLHLFTRRVKAFELTAGSTARHQERFASSIGLRA